MIRLAGFAVFMVGLAMVHPGLAVMLLGLIIVATDGEEGAV